MKVQFRLPDKIYDVEALSPELALRKLVLFLWGPRCSYSMMMGSEPEICRVLPILDLHHVFITQGQWRGNSVPEYIHHPFNVVGICRTHHLSHGDSEAFRRMAWKLQSQRYGVDNLIRYLTDAPTSVLDRFWLTEGYWTPVLN